MKSTIIHFDYGIQISIGKKITQKRLYMRVDTRSEGKAAQFIMVRSGLVCMT